MTPPPASGARGSERAARAPGAGDLARAAMI
jgi:hypothetical protein